MATLLSHEGFGSIKEEYKLMINPQPQRIILLLKYPNRQPWELYSDDCGKKPLELRIKPKCGLIEVDIPIDVHYHYDREKGLEFGSALRKKAFKGDSKLFYGISSGLDYRTVKKDEDDLVAPEEPSLDNMLEDFDNANSKGYVMNKITLGGRIEPFKDGDPMYMLATFKDDLSTWTPLDGMVMLRPQFEHLDALRVQQKLGLRATRLDDGDKKESKAEDVNMTVKDTEDEEPQDDLYGGMAETLKTLRAMADEPWQRLYWIDSEDDRAYAIWEETLIYPNAENAPNLVSDMTKEQYLDAISCPRIDPINKGRNIMRPLGADSDDFGLTTDEEKPPPMCRPRDAKIRYLIEGVCREISKKSEDEHQQVIKFLRKHFKADHRYMFLKTYDPLHHFFLWRLKRNRAKRGWSLKMLRKKEVLEELNVDPKRASEPVEKSGETHTPRESRGTEMEGAGGPRIQSTKPLNKKRKNQRGDLSTGAK